MTNAQNINVDTDIKLNPNKAVDVLPFVATNRFTFRSKARKYLDRIRQVHGVIKYMNWREVYSAHERSVKWSVVIVYQANQLI